MTGSVRDDDGYRVLLLKTDRQGNETWRKNFGNGVGESVQQTVDGGYIVTGTVEVDRDNIVLLLKTNELGNMSRQSRVKL